MYENVSFRGQVSARKFGGSQSNKTPCFMGILAGPPLAIAGLIKGTINHWFPLIRSAINPLFQGGAALGGVP